MRRGRLSTPCCRPFAGAWIETLAGGSNRALKMSPLRGGVDRNWIVAAGVTTPPAVAPSRGRGSKRPGRPGPASPRIVAPSRGRGSKRGRGLDPGGLFGRPFAGAWIETSISCISLTRRFCRPFAGAWIETTRPPSPRCRRRKSPLRGGVDRNKGNRYYAEPLFASPLRGGVDRNRVVSRLLKPAQAVAPSRGRGSKPAPSGAAAGSPWVAPSRGRGSKPHDRPADQVRPAVAPSRGRGSKQRVGDHVFQGHESPLRGGVDRNFLGALFLA